MKAFFHRLFWERTVHWLLTILTLLYIISGLELYSGIISKLTFGIFTKPLAYKMHVYMLVPFAVLLIAHIALVIIPRIRKH